MKTLIFLIITAVSVVIFGCKKDNSGSKIPSNGLIAYYPFNGNANDASGNGNNGTFASGAALTMDKHGNANKACNVETGYVEIPDNNSLDLENYTLSVWFKFNDSPDAFNCLLGKNYEIAYAIGIGSGGSIDCPAPVGTKRPMLVYIGGQSTSISTSDFACGSDTWTHAAVTYDNATGAIQLYINGSLFESGSIAAGSIGNSSDSLAIGADGYYHDKFTGDVDEVYIYNRVLSAKEIKSIYLNY